jgi:hypothetical protein
MVCKIGLISAELQNEQQGALIIGASTQIVGQRKNLMFYSKNRQCRTLEPKSRSFALFGDLCSSNRCSIAGTDAANGWKQGASPLGRVWASNSKKRPKKWRRAS